MIFNPITNELFTDSGIFIKKLDCPFKLEWKDLKVNNNESKYCSICQHLVLDTVKFNN